MRSKASMFLSISKAVLTCWLYHGAEHRCRKKVSCYYGTTE